MKSRFLLAAVLSLFVAGSAYARGGSGDGRFYIQENLVPVFQSLNDGDATTSGEKDTTTIGVDSRTTVGYKFWGKLLVGGTFNYLMANQETDGVSEFNVNAWDIGPTIGFVHRGFHANFSYFLLGEQTREAKTLPSGDTIETTWKDPTGYQVDVGYRFDIGSGFRIGPSVVWRFVEYDKQDIENSVAPAANVSDQSFATKPLSSETKVMISASYEF